MVPIHNNGDPKRSKGISKIIVEYAHVHSQPPQRRWLRASCSKESREMKAIRKATETAREAYTGVST